MGRSRVLALGSAAARLTPAMFDFLNKKIPVVLICMDNDYAGKKTAGRMLIHLNNAVYWPIPETYGKDPGEAWKKLNINSWIKDGLGRQFSS